MKYQLWTYDVWGNETDGYEVNDRFHDCDVEIPESVLNGSNDDLIRFLKREDLIKKSIQHRYIEIDGDDMAIYFSYRGKPVMELTREG